MKTYWDISKTSFLNSSCRRESLYFCSLDSLIWFTFIINLQEDMLNDCDHRSLIWNREITKAEPYHRAFFYFCSLDSLIWFTCINNLQECHLCHSDIIREDMLNDRDHRRLIWKREITKAETYLKASLYFLSPDSLIWFKFIINLQESQLCHSDIIREDMLNDCDHRRQVWKKKITKAET